MLKYEVTKDMTPKKIRDAAKEELLNLFIDFLVSFILIFTKKHNKSEKKLMYS